MKFWGPTTVNWVVLKPRRRSVPWYERVYSDNPGYDPTNDIDPNEWEASSGATPTTFTFTIDAGSTGSNTGSFLIHPDPIEPR